jgi:hypothetical protein
MQSVRTAILRAVIIVAALSLAACGAGSTGQTTSGTPSATQAPTAQPTAAKAKPTTPPKVTLQFCESIMSVADANQIMKPPAPITKITAQANDELGVCGYTSPQTPLGVVKVLVDEKAYAGPNPVPEATIAQMATKLANEPGVTITITTMTPVSGVGDQAEFLAASESSGGVTLYVDAIYVIYGHVAFMCDDFHLNTKPNDATQQTALTQCAQRAVKVL